MKMHTQSECCIKVDALKDILDNIKNVSHMEQEYSIAHLAASGLDLIRELKGEFDKEVTDGR